MSNDRGSASLEFIAATVILLVPLIYLTIALASIQNQTLGAEAVARHLSRTLARGGEAADVDRTLTVLLDEYGIDRETVTVDVRCTQPGACPRAGAILTVSITAQAALPLVPAVFGNRLAVPIGASAVNKVSDYEPQP